MRPAGDEHRTSGDYAAHSSGRIVRGARGSQPSSFGTAARWPCLGPRAPALEVPARHLVDFLGCPTSSLGGHDSSRPFGFEWASRMRAAGLRPRGYAAFEYLRPKRGFHVERRRGARECGVPPGESHHFGERVPAAEVRWLGPGVPPSGRVYLRITALRSSSGFAMGTISAAAPHERGPFGTVGSVVVA